MIISSYYHTIILSSHHSTKWLKSFSVPSLGFRHILSHLPLLQGSLPKNKGSWGNNFSRRTCLRGLKNHSPFKTSLFWKKNWPPKIFFDVSLVLEERASFQRLWQIDREKLLPVVRLFFHYEPWWRGKSGTPYFFGWFWTKNELYDFVVLCHDYMIFWWYNNMILWWTQEMSWSEHTRARENLDRSAPPELSTTKSPSWLISNSAHL